MADDKNMDVTDPLWDHQVDEDPEAYHARRNADWIGSGPDFTERYEDYSKTNEEDAASDDGDSGAFLNFEAFGKALTDAAAEPAATSSKVKLGKRSSGTQALEESKSDWKCRKVYQREPFLLSRLSYEIRNRHFDGQGYIMHIHSPIKPKECPQTIMACISVCVRGSDLPLDLHSAYMLDDPSFPPHTASFLYAYAETVVVSGGNSTSGPLQFLSGLNMNLEDVLRPTQCIPQLNSRTQLARALELRSTSSSLYYWRPIWFSQTLCLPQVPALRFKEFQIPIYDLYSVYDASHLKQRLGVNDPADVGKSLKGILLLQCLQSVEVLEVFKGVRDASEDFCNVSMLGGIMDEVGGLNPHIQSTTAAGWLVMGDSSVTVKVLGINPDAWDPETGKAFKEDLVGGIWRANLSQYYTNSRTGFILAFYFSGSETILTEIRNSVPNVPMIGLQVSTEVIFIGQEIPAGSMAPGLVVPAHLDTLESRAKVSLFLVSY